MVSGEKMMLTVGIIFALCIFSMWFFVPEEDIYISPSMRTEKLITRVPREQFGKLDTSIAQFRERHYDSVFVYSLGNEIAFNGFTSSKNWHYQETVGVIFQKIEKIQIDAKKRKITATVSRDWVGASAISLIGSIVIGLIIITIALAFARVK